MVGRIRERSLRGLGSTPLAGGRTSAAVVEFAPLRMDEHHGMTVAGLKGHFLTGGDPAIPSQWMRFAGHLGTIARQVVAYHLWHRLERSDEVNRLRLEMRPASAAILTNDVMDSPMK